ncbi:IS110 family transposase [Nonomuraea ferruginea]|uniref:IS110 family transposase n=1 Tax=Nonomuraea ferruginea TaxID=46174 RepID=A0ABT4SRN6_9ACTN|nr:IS110 family transposase [Nonomuraea ferruginea]MDA0639809.1 IS110 family transposase [Nonomuraea ferruginea]
MRITCGIDWSEKHHDVAFMNADAVIVARARISDDLAGFRRLMELLAEYAGEEGPTSVEIAIETDKGLLVAALAAAGFTLFPINPRAVARYRERHGQAGGKSDPGDAAVLADVLRTDRHQHRPLPADSTLARGIKATARQHQEAIWARQQTVNRLRSLLREYYPAALTAFPVLTQRTALAVLRAAPDPRSAAKLTPGRMEALLRRAGRRIDAGLPQRLSTQLRQQQLRQPEEVEHAFGVAVAGLVDVIKAMSGAIDALEEELADLFARHEQAAIITSMPGLGTVLGARILGELGDDEQRFTDVAGLRGFAGTAPITRASGKMKIVSARYIRNQRLADACHWWAFAAITKSRGARAHYDQRRATGDSHNAALRNLANKMLAKLWHCLRNGVPYTEAIAWPRPFEEETPTAA